MRNSLVESSAAAMKQAAVNKLLEIVRYSTDPEVRGRRDPGSAEQEGPGHPEETPGPHQTMTSISVSYREGHRPGGPPRPGPFGASRSPIA